MSMCIHLQLVFKFNSNAILFSHPYTKIMYMYVVHVVNSVVQNL